MKEEWRGEGDKKEGKQERRRKESGKQGGKNGGGGGGGSPLHHPSISVLPAAFLLIGFSPYYTHCSGDSSICVCV